MASSAERTPGLSARKFYKRLLYDVTCDTSQVTVGLLETREVPERRSGVEAWSLRLASSLVELPFGEFVSRYEGSADGGIPFHRIAWFRQAGAVVWEAENLRAKAGDGHHAHAQQQLPPGAQLSGSFLGCSPPAGSFMARLAAAQGCGGASPGLPPRAASIPLDASGASSSGSGWLAGAAAAARQQRLSGGDVACSPGSSSWGGGGLGSSWAGSPVLLGSSPCGRPGSSSGVGGLLGASPRGGSCGPSPHGSCGSSWTGSSPLAAAAAAGDPRLMHSLLRAPLAGPLGSVGLLAAAGPREGAGEVAAGVAQGEEAPQPVDFSALPDECWLNVLARLAVRELCCASRVSRSLRSLASRSFLWTSAYERLFGAPPPADWTAPTVKRLCRRSELRASRWLESEQSAAPAGFRGTAALQLDESKVVSGDGCAVRLWAHDSGRRIATLRGHAGRVTAVAFDDELILSGCSQGQLKLWAMDELKLSRTLRHHTEPVTAVALLAGLPISAGADGSVCLWDAAAPNSPLVVLEAGGPVAGLQVVEERGHLVTASGGLGVWDVNTAQLLHTLVAPAALTSSASSASLAVAAFAAEPHDAAAAAAAAVGDNADADAVDGVLLQDGWLLDDDDDDDQAAIAAALGSGAGSLSGGGGGGKPYTCVSCHGNLLAAGRAGGVVLFDLRSQEPVGAVRAGGAGKPHAAPCVGVQLDDWKLLTGFAAASGSSNGGSAGGGAAAAWWQGGEGDAAAAGAAAGACHSLDLYDIRAVPSFSSCNASAAGAGGHGVWGGAPLLSLPLASRATCFQFYGQHLLVGQEGTECCLLSFNPPGTFSSRAAAAWGFGGGGSGAACSGSASAVYGASPGASGGHGDDAPGSSGKKKKGGAKVPAKKQTRYPKRATR